MRKYKWNCNRFSDTLRKLQIFSEKSETRDAELAVLERKTNDDVIVVAHTRNKVGVGTG